MRQLIFALVVVTLALSCAAQAPDSKSSAPPAPGKADPAAGFRDEAVVLEHLDTTYRMHSDGTGERIQHALLRAQSEGIVRQFGVLSFAYAAANETPTITYVRVHKADGTTIETPPADAIDMAAQVTREAPLYSDLKEKHIPVRSLSVGDTLEYEIRTAIDKPEAPGQFWGAYHFTLPGSIIVLSETLALEFPKDKYVQVWSPNHKPEISDHDNLRSYRWTLAQLIPAPRTNAQSDDAKSKTKPPKDPDEDADGRKLPSIAWTTFHTWAEVGDWYKTLALPRAQPTDSLRARAEEITKDAKSPQEQIQAIYQFVSTHIRYVGIDFGVGRYQPHLAADVLANQYGDCKDKDTLLEALLRAKGFKTAPALIGAGITPTPDVPSPATFNHVITTVILPNAAPDARIWLDSTPETAPYRYLSATLRDEQALIVPPDAPATLERTPAEPPYPLESHFNADGSLDKDGKFIAAVTASYRTDDEVFVRSLARGVAPAEWNKASQYIVSVTGFSGTTSDTHFTATDDLGKPMQVAYTYTRHPYGDWDNRRIIPPFPLLEIPVISKDDGEPDADIELGAPRSVFATASIQLPDGYTTDLPDPIHLHTDFITFDKTYRFDGHQIIIDRKVIILRKKIPHADWKHYLTFVADAHLDSEPWIQLVQPFAKVESKPVPIAINGAKPSIPGSTTPGLNKNDKPTGEKPVIIQLAPPDAGTFTQAASPAVSADANTDELIQKAGSLLRSGDWDGATVVLDRIKARNPSQRYLWASYGFVAMRHNEITVARGDFEKELSTYPDSPPVVLALADVQNRDNDWSSARKTLSTYLSQHPDNVAIAVQLASMETAKDDNEGALKTLQTATQHAPEDRNLLLALSEALLRANHPEEAAASAKSLLDDTNDPLILNNAAYVLADAGLSLPEAEAASRKSITTLEEKSASITTAEANSSAFAQSHILISSWDTLGWILFREGKFDDAKPYLVAAWRNGLRPEVGDHLGQLYEALGKKSAAYETYDQADNALDQSNLSPATKRHLRESAVRLHSSAALKAKLGREGLQDSRTYKLQGSSPLSGWGTFRLQLTTTGAIDARQMSGEGKLASLAQSIQSTKFPDLIPAGSKAHLLRSGVVSCSLSGSCELVLVPDGDLRTERY